MKMVVHGIEKVEKTLGKMDTGVDGVGWVANAVMALPNGKKRYKLCAIGIQYIIS